MNKTSLIAIAFSASILMATSVALAQQGGNPQVSVVNLQVVQNADGSQSVITPKGDLAPLPGAGVNGRTAQIYLGSQGGFWYTDRSGQTVDLAPAVQALQARRAQAAQPVQVPQYAPMPEYGQQTQQQPSQQVIVQQQPSNGSSTASAMGTAAAAGMGAMAGAAMGGHYAMPYGTPMYYGAHGNPYYYNNGEQRNLDDLNQNQKTAMYNKYNANQTQEYKQKQVAATGYANKQQQQAAAASQASASDHQNYQKQQQYYSQQMKQNPNKFQQTASNPFVADQAAQSGRGRGGERGRSAEASQGGGGRFAGADRGGYGGGGGGRAAEFGGGGGRGGRRR